MEEEEEEEEKIDGMGCKVLVCLTCSIFSIFLYFAFIDTIVITNAAMEKAASARATEGTYLL